MGESVETEGGVVEPLVVEKRVVKVLAAVLKRELDPRAIRDRHLHDLGMDSIGMIDLIGGLETEFGVTIDPDDVGPENFESVAAICAYILRRVGV